MSQSNKFPGYKTKKQLDLEAHQRIEKEGNNVKRRKHNTKLTAALLNYAVPILSVHATKESMPVELYGSSRTRRTRLVSGWIIMHFGASSSSQVSYTEQYSDSTNTVITEDFLVIGHAGIVNRDIDVIEATIASPITPRGLARQSMGGPHLNDYSLSRTQTNWEVYARNIGLILEDVGYEFNFTPDMVD